MVDLYFKQKHEVKNLNTSESDLSMRNREDIYPDRDRKPESHGRTSSYGNFSQTWYYQTPAYGESYQGRQRNVCKHFKGNGVYRWKDCSHS